LRDGLRPQVSAPPVESPPTWPTGLRTVYILAWQGRPRQPWTTDGGGAAISNARRSGSSFFGSPLPRTDDPSSSATVCNSDFASRVLKRGIGVAIRLQGSHVGAIDRKGSTCTEPCGRGRGFSTNIRHHQPRLPATARRRIVFG
jgi:hypothetical protein